MIAGLGEDMVDIRRIEAVLTRKGDAFCARILSPSEQEHAAAFATVKARASYIAKRFAAKEACAKALGTGIRDGVMFRDIVVSNNALGRPMLDLSGGALKQLESIAANGRLHLSLSDEYPYAHATVIIEALDANPKI